MKNAFLTWLDDRTGLPALCRKLGHWEVPARDTLGRFLSTMIVFTFLLQAATGLLLWLYYSPGATSAWESLFYIQFVLPGGYLVRGIHHYAAQLLTVLLGLYLFGLVLRGAYRSPREFVFWSAGLLFLITLGSSLTGDLLSWTLSGVSATLVRVRFLQMLPGIGTPLFQLAIGGTEVGTLTIPRFLLLHILIFGGGFFVTMILWRIFDYRSAGLSSATVPAKEPNRRIPLWSNEILRVSLACLLVGLVLLVLVYRQPILAKFHSGNAATESPFPEASRGAVLGAPADTSPASFYDAARPEWTFRALYHFSNLKRRTAEGDVDVFPGSRKYIPIFVVSGALLFYLFLIPVIGRLKIGHYFNIAVVSLLLLGIVYLTIASYVHDYFDPSMESFREDVRREKLLARRAVELCFAPEGIPPTGVLTVLERDPYLRGPALFQQHCAVCHSFTPLRINSGTDPEFERVHPDFKPIPCETPKAPNLYDPIRKRWISGFLDRGRIRNDDYFGNTKFAKNGSMLDYVRGTLKEILDEDEMMEENEIKNATQLDRLVDLLLEEAQREGPRSETVDGVEDWTPEKLRPFMNFTCVDCHRIYTRPKPSVQAPDLRGYMSKEWMIDFIADPESPRFYGPPAGRNKGNDEMPAFHRSAEEAVMTLEEIEVLVLWLRGRWFRYEKPVLSTGGDADLSGTVPDENDAPGNVGAPELKPLETNRAEPPPAG